MVSPISVSDIWIVTTLSLTSTVWVFCPIGKVASICSALSTSIATLIFLYGWKPGELTSSSYRPIGTTGNEYFPWSLVVVVCLIPLPRLLRVTVAPATNAPLGSLTIPEIRPATSAHAVLSKKQSTTPINESLFIAEHGLTFISFLLTGVRNNCSPKGPSLGKGSAGASGSHSPFVARIGATVPTLR